MFASSADGSCSSYASNNFSIAWSSRNSRPNGFLAANWSSVSWICCCMSFAELGSMLSFMLSGAASIDESGVESAVSSNVLCVRVCIDGPGLLCARVWCSVGVGAPLRLRGIIGPPSSSSLEFCRAGVPLLVAVTICKEDRTLALV